MLRVALSLQTEGQELHLSCVTANCQMSHRLTGDDWKAFRSWNTTYHHILETRSNEEARLLRLGNDIRLWIEKCFPHALAAIFEAGQAPLLWEVVAPRITSENRAFLDAPWEVAGDENAPWAQQADIKFCPVRRCGAQRESLEPSPYALTVVFMAAAPEGATQLQYEAEERAIQQLTSDMRLELMVEDFGMLSSLSRFVTEHHPDVIHLSCHGELTEQGPRIGLENEIGKEVKVTPQQLNDELEHKNARLLFLSACQTARSAENRGELVPSLAWGVLNRSAPAVLGWAGNVLDHEATQFAHLLYKRLSDQRPLEQAVAMARYEMLTMPTSGTANVRDWHLARLYLAPQGGGVLATGSAGARRVRRAGNKVALARNNQSPVAGPDQFVGRRRELQTVLREFQEHNFGGVLIHGIGQQGKSSLAERVKDRYEQRGYAVPVIYDLNESAHNYRAAAVWDTISRELRDRNARAHCEKHKEEISRNPVYLKEALRQLLEDDYDGDGRTDPTLARRQPLLLIIDDFEKVLNEESGSTPGFKNAEFAATMQAIIEAFCDAQTQSRLLLTSRFLFTLPDGARDWGQKLFTLSLPPMAPSDSVKQAVTQRRRLLSAEKQATQTPDEQQEETKRTARLIEAARGHAGLQDYLFALSLENAARCDELLAEIEDYWQSGAAAQHEKSEIFGYLQKLALGKLLGLLTETQRHLLRASLLFDLPVPANVMEHFGIGAPADRSRLETLGLWYAQDDDFQAGRRALALNPPLRLLLEPLDESLFTALSSLVVQPLFEAWGGATGSDKRTIEHEMQLTQLALFAADAEVLVHTARWTVQALYDANQFTAAAAIGGKTIEIINDEGTEVPLLLRKFTAESEIRLGEMETAATLLQEALSQSQAQKAAGAGFDEDDYAALLLAHARLLRQQGVIDEALKEFEEFQALARTPRSHAVALGEIARLKAQQGKVKEAFADHEKELQVYKDLGDKRSHAITLGEIARLKAQQGEVEEALNLQQQRLQVMQELKDKRGEAIALGEIARLKAQRGKVEEAFADHEKALQVYKDLGDKRSHAITLSDIARLKVDKGEVEEAFADHEKALQVYKDLGDKHSHAITLGDIARLKVDKGEVEEALKLHQQRLEVYNEIGSMDGIANASWSMAQIELRQEKYQVAYEHLATAYAILNKIGRLDGACVVGWDLGIFLCQAGQTEEGLPILARSHAGFLKLGSPDCAAQVHQAIEFFSSENG